MVWAAVLAERGVLDFAGGIVVHRRRGLGVVIALRLGRRQGFPARAAAAAPGDHARGVLLWSAVRSTAASAGLRPAGRPNAIINTQRRRSKRRCGVSHRAGDFRQPTTSVSQRGHSRASDGHSSGGFHFGGTRSCSARWRRSFASASSDKNGLRSTFDGVFAVHGAAAARRSRLRWYAPSLGGADTTMHEHGFDARSAGPGLAAVVVGGGSDRGVGLRSVILPCG